MPLPIKDLLKLNKDFNDLIELLLANEKIDSGKIEDSKVDRAPILELLRSTLHYLTNSPDNLIRATRRSTTFYGIVYLAIEHINKTRWTSSSITKRALLELVGESETQQPTPEQSAQFHKAANFFLLSIYTDRDSRKGINPKHPLNKLSAQNLSKFLTAGYRLEKNSQKNSLTSIASKKVIKDNVLPIKFQFYHIPPKTSDLSLGNWEELHAAANSLIQQELGQKYCATLKDLGAISATRATQLSILKDLRSTLLEIPEEKYDGSSRLKSGFTADKKAAIYAGILFLIYEQIKSESPLKSYVFEQLKEILDPDEISPQDKEALVTVANEFICFMTIAPSEKGKAFREEHLFSKIVNLNLLELLKSFQDTIYKERIAALNKLMMPRIKAENPPLSWLPSFKSLSMFGGFKEDPKETKTKEGKNQKNKTASGSLTTLTPPNGN